MGLSEIMKLLFRLAVIITVVAFQFFITTQSAWPSCAVDVVRNDTESEEIMVTGDARNFCHLQTPTLPSPVIIQVPATSTPFYLYLYREDCTFKYVMIDGYGEPCHVVSTQTKSKLNLRGNINVTLQKLHSMDRTQPSSCSKSDQDLIDTVTVSSNVKCKFKVYKQAIFCSQQSYEDANNVYCSLNFPNNCNASVGYREVELKCLDSEEENNRVLMVYPDITHINLRANNIIDIDSRTFHALSKLKVINLGKNHLQQLPTGLFHNLSDLIQLDVSENLLEYIDRNLFLNLQQLTKLFVQRNHLTVLSQRIFQTLPNLSMLLLQSNKIKTLESKLFQGLTKLNLLDLHDNMLSTIPIGSFDDMLYLNILWLNQNHLQSIESMLFHTLTNLTYLALNDNMLTKLSNDTFRGLYSLQFLALDKNQLLTIPNDLFYGLTRLTRLSLQQNDLKTIPNALFHGLTQLNWLGLHKNQLQTIHNASFYGLIRLEWLGLHENQLKTIDNATFHGLTRLRWLLLHRNQLRTIPNALFSELSHLFALDLYENQLKAIPHDLFHGLAQLAVLPLTNNSIMTIDFGVFKDLRNVKTLTLDINNLTQLNSGVFNGLEKLQYLLLGRNQLTRMDPDVFHPLSKLILLSLQYNLLTEFKTMSLWGLTNLKELSLGGNQISIMSKNIFEGTKNLTHLALEDNQIDHLEFDIFNKTVKLNYVDLSYNRLQIVPSMEHLINLKTLNLRGNPLFRIEKRTLSKLPKGVDVYASQHEICQCYVRIDSMPTCRASDERSPYLTCDRLMADRTLVAMMWLIAINAIGGNIFVLVWRQRQKNTVQDLFLSNLAISDLIMGVYMLIIACSDVYFGENFPMKSEAWRSGIMCRIAGTLSILSSEASVFLITLISIDRLIGIRFPFSTKKFSKRSACLAIILTWLFSLALGAVPSSLAGRNEKFYDNSNVCIGLPLSLIDKYSYIKYNIIVDNKEANVGRTIEFFNTTYEGSFPGMHFSNAVFLGVNGICYLIILCCYVEIIRATLKSAKRSGLKKEIKEELRMTLKVTAIVATDFFCWFPVVCLGILVQARVITLPASVYAWYVTFVIPINSAINPYLYTISNIISDWRKEQVKRQKQLEMVQKQGRES